MSKRPGEVVNGGNGKLPRVEGGLAGVVKKTGPRLPMLMYKEGEPLHELREFLTMDNGGPQCVEVRIPPHFLASNNRQVRSRQLWGSDIYTSDSDLVAVLMHYGYIYHTIPQPVRDVAEVRAVVRPMPPQPSYPSTARNSIRSRAWAAATPGCAYSVDKAWVVTRTGNSYDLRPSTEGPPAAAVTFAPMHLDRMITRSAVGPAARHRLVQEITAVFNLANEPWIKYTPTAICDRGLKPHDWTSARLHTHVLYLESHTQRYELSRLGNNGEGGEEHFTLARCHRPLQARVMRGLGVPLPPAEKEVLLAGVAWEELRWGLTTLVVRDITLEPIRVHFMPIEAEQRVPDDEGAHASEQR